MIKSHSLTPILEIVNPNLDHPISDLITRTKGLDDIHDDVAALAGGYNLTDILDRLDHATYGLPALNTDLDALLARLTATRADYLDKLPTIETYTDILDDATYGLIALRSHVSGEVDDLITRAKGLDAIYDYAQYLADVATPVSPVAGSIAAELDTLVAATSP